LTLSPRRTFPGLTARREFGARLARPGEFTLRAFLAGKLDLLQAEAVLGVIDAHDHHELQAALGQLAGGLSGLWFGHTHQGMITLVEPLSK